MRIIQQISKSLYSALNILTSRTLEIFVERASNPKTNGRNATREPRCGIWDGVCARTSIDECLEPRKEIPLNLPVRS